MTSVLQNSNVVIRPVQYRDLEELNGYVQSRLRKKMMAAEIQRQLRLLSRWYGLLKCLSLFQSVSVPVLHLRSRAVSTSSGNASGVAV